MVDKFIIYEIDYWNNHHHTPSKGNTEVVNSRYVYSEFSNTCTT